MFGIRGRRRNIIINSDALQNSNKPASIPAGRDKNLIKNFTPRVVSYNIMRDNAAAV